MLPNFPKSDWCKRMNRKSEGRKPYPWRCGKCREQAVYGATVDYTTQMYHYDRVYTVKIDGLQMPKCKNCGQVMLDSDAMGVLDDLLRRQANLLTPEQIRDHRLKSNLTQEALAAALGVSQATVAAWEAGDQIQTRSLDNLLRLFFGLAQVREILTTEQIRTFLRQQC